MIEFAKVAPELSGDIASWLSEVDRTLISPAIGVSLALSEVDDLIAVARELEADERVSDGARSAVREALP